MPEQSPSRRLACFDPASRTRPRRNSRAGTKGGPITAGADAVAEGGEAGDNTAAQGVHVRASTRIRSGVTIIVDVKIERCLSVPTIIICWVGF